MALAELGYDERFRRIWTLYLAYCEAGFAERRICDIQLLLSKPHAQLTSAPVWAAGIGSGRTTWRRAHDQFGARQRA